VVTNFWIITLAHLIQPWLKFALADVAQGIELA
jgi:hypothetical protein